LVIRILCVCMVLMLLFEDLLRPITILAAPPLTVGGAFLDGSIAWPTWCIACAPVSA
jgi:multidrug efflux pump subunit AcrB